MPDTIKNAGETEAALSAIFPRCHTEMCLELSVKVGEVFKSALFGDAHDGVICCVKRLGGSVEPIFPQQQDKGLAGHLSEPAHEMVWAALAKRGSIRHADRLAVMSRDPLQYGF